jgi:hypothetical protein
VPEEPAVPEGAEDPTGLAVPTGLTRAPAAGPSGLGVSRGGGDEPEDAGVAGVAGTAVGVAAGTDASLEESVGELPAFSGGAGGGDSGGAAAGGEVGVRRTTAVELGEGRGRGVAVGSTGA